MIIFSIKKVFRGKRFDFELVVLRKMIKIVLKYLGYIIFLFLHKNNTQATVETNILMTVAIYHIN
jgi:hypothetical protein